MSDRQLKARAEVWLDHLDKCKDIYNSGVESGNSQKEAFISAMQELHIRTHFLPNGLLDVIKPLYDELLDGLDDLPGPESEGRISFNIGTMTDAQVQRKTEIIEEMMGKLATIINASK
jgi:hypothetical protein